MYLPLHISQAQVLITVKTYPQPSGKYEELVCTAGLFQGEKWIRIYPIPFRFLQEEQQYPKYGWIELDLVRKTDDFRPKSYSPRRGLDEPLHVVEKIGTVDHWATRKQYVLQNTFTSMKEYKSFHWRH